MPVDHPITQDHQWYRFTENIIRILTRSVVNAARTLLLPVLSGSDWSNGT